MKKLDFIRINIMLIVASIFIISGCPCPEFLQYGTVRGIVTDLSNNPLADVKVSLEDRVVYTNDQGQFIIEDAMEGKMQVIEFSKAAYQLFNSSEIISEVGLLNNLGFLTAFIDKNQGRSFTVPQAEKKSRNCKNN